MTILSQSRRVWIGAALVAVALLLNASWAQGALVVSVRSQDCDPVLLQSARARVQALFGAVRSAPLVGCLPAPVLGIDVPYGQTRFAPLLPAVILLGPEGQNVDVAAHEWAHAELSARVGVLTRSWRLPTWLDEGLAMQVDKRPEYGDAALAALLQKYGAPNLRELATGAGFFTSDLDAARLRYGYARCVVAQWLRANDAFEGLLPWLEQRTLWRSVESDAWDPYVSLCLELTSA